MLILQKIEKRHVAFLKKLTRVLIYLCVMSFIVSGVAWGALDWKEFSSKEDQFSVSMPGKAEFKIQKLPTPLGLIDGREWIVETDNGPVYLIMVSQYPLADWAQVDRSVLVDQAIKGQAGEDGKVRSQKDIQVEGNPGREAVIEKSNFILMSKVTMVGNRLYQLIVAVESSSESSVANDVKKYFNSFKLLK